MTHRTDETLLILNKHRNGVGKTDFSDKLIKYYILEPEASLSLGENTILDTTTHPPTIKELDLIFEAWLGDDILEIFPCFFVTQKLKQLIELNNLKKVNFELVNPTKSDTFRELHPYQKLPTIYSLKVLGKPKCDDFGISKENLLIVSHSCLNVLSQANLNHCDIEEIMI
ncbi:MAG: hypothetical protein KC646_17335 [Candidatus Cloacimonetes bacterium]|nr:hypothetical protein [Candidatus Cloacimonadota bacterium]